MRSPNYVSVRKEPWNLLKLLFLMMKKLSFSREKLVRDINHVISKWKHLWNTLQLENPVFTHQAMRIASPRRHGFYEFSCSSSSSSPAKSYNHFFTCVSEGDVEEVEIKSVLVYAKWEFEDSGECEYPLTPFSVRVSNYSLSEEEEEEGEGDGVGFEIDDMAEEFIEKFYGELRAQKLEALLQYIPRGGGGHVLIF